MLNRHEVLKIKFIRDNKFIENEEYRNSYSNKIYNIHNNSHLSRIMNRCILSGRARAVFRLAKINRIKFKDAAERGKLVGIKHRTW